MKFNIYNIECIRTLLQYYRIVLIQINMCCIPNDSPPHNIYTDYILYGRITSITLNHGASRVCVQSRTYRPIHVTCAPNTYKNLPTHVSDVSSRSYPSTTPIPTHPLREDLAPPILPQIRLSPVSQLGSFLQELCTLHWLSQHIGEHICCAQMYYTNLLVQLLLRYPEMADSNVTRSF